MPLEAPLAGVAERVAALNARFDHHAAHDVLHHALTDPQIAPAAVVSSFGAESVVLLHLLSRIDRTTPILFLDTEMLFPETLDYQEQLANRLRLTGVIRVRPDRDETFVADSENALNRTDPDACCALRKSRPLEKALNGYEAWITGRKRFQSGSRADVEFFEIDDAGRIKVNPLAHWSQEDVRDYISNNRLPRHPLVGKGYPSLGCAPCTTRVAPGEDPRAGRWRGQNKTECGIHSSVGVAQRAEQTEFLK